MSSLSPTPFQETPTKSPFLTRLPPLSNHQNLHSCTTTMLSSSIFPFWVFFVFFFVLFFNLLSSSHSLPFSPANNNITLFGDAHFSNISISLTQELNCLSPPPPPAAAAALSSSPSSSFSGVGRAFYAFPIRFLDTKTNTAASFSCRFSFRLTPSSRCPFGDGFAFFITSKSDSVSFSDGYMGLPENPTDTQDSFVAVEFDTSLDPSLGDINDNHVGIDVNTVVSLTSIDASSMGIDLKSGYKMTAWIEYGDGEKMMRVWVGYSKVKPPIPLLVAQIDLSPQFKEFMQVGFTAANVRGSATHLVDSWRFKTYGFLSSVMPLDIVEGGDCFMCFRGDSGNENGHMDKKVGELGLALGGFAAFIIFVSTIVVTIILCMIRRRRILNSRGHKEGQIYRFQGNRVPKRLSLAAIKSATKDFNKKRIIGEGGSATVYEGSIPSFGLVAVKRFRQVNQSGPIYRHFTTEFETMVGCLRHEHLVQLQGWCCEGNELVLVYEYMVNGSLDKILHRNNSLMVFLTWERRQNIVLGIASALIYLHEECERQIIHRDVKTCNIMLDDEFNAKLGDFGLAEVYEHSSMTREATVPAGTMGYLAPEYVYLGIPTVKTDVYSFGVVVLEVASGKKPVDDYGTLLVYWVWDLWEKRNLMEAADLRLRGGFNRLEMERMLMVGLSCVHPNYEMRPTMKEAARMIRGEGLMPILPERKPTVSIQPILAEGSEEIMNFDGDENSNLDDTPWLTPKTHF